MTRLLLKIGVMKEIGATLMMKKWMMLWFGPTALTITVPSSVLVAIMLIIIASLVLISGCGGRKLKAETQSLIIPEPAHRENRTLE